MESFLKFIFYRPPLQYAVRDEQGHPAAIRSMRPGNNQNSNGGELELREQQPAAFRLATHLAAIRECLKSRRYEYKALFRMRQRKLASGL
jgi:hypothetical protein